MGRSSLKNAHFVIIHYQTWPSQAILVSDWLIFLKSSLKPLGQLIRNLVESIWPSGFRGEDFFKSANQKQELPVAAMFGNVS
jgi:hypothetical protein